MGWLRTKGFIAALLNGHHQISPLRPMSRGEFDFISQIIGQAESTIITREPSTARFFNSHLIGKWFDPSHNFIKVALLHGRVLVCALENHYLT